MVQLKVRGCFGEFLHPAAPGMLGMYPVSNYVNKVGTEGKRCVGPVEGRGLPVSSRGRGAPRITPACHISYFTISTLNKALKEFSSFFSKLI